MEEPKGNPIKLSHHKLPSLRSYLQACEEDSLRNALSFLARKIKTNDLYIKTLLTAFLEKEDDIAYYPQFIGQGLKSILVARKKKITPKRWVKLNDWLDAQEELIMNLSEKKNIRELWLLCWNLQTQFWAWIGYEDFHHSSLKGFLEKVTLTIEVCYQSTPASLLKNEIIEKQTELLFDHGYPLIDYKNNPFTFLWKMDIPTPLRPRLMDWLRQKREGAPLSAEEKSTIDKIQFQTFYSQGLHEEGVALLLQGYNPYENLTYLTAFCMENRDASLAKTTVHLLSSSSLNPDFVDGITEHLYKGKLIDTENLGLVKLKLFLMHGKQEALVKAKAMGYSFEDVEQHLLSLHIEQTDVRFAQLCLTYDQMQKFRELLLHSDFFVSVIQQVEKLQPKGPALGILQDAAMLYLRNTLGPHSHNVVHQLCKYLKYTRQLASLKMLKSTLKKEFPERSLLLDAIKNL
jgi:hypothetical protein